MADGSFARDGLAEERWDERLRRITNETRECVLATRALIARSRESLARADRIVKRQQRPRLPR